MEKIEWPKFGFLGLLICLVSVLAVAPFFQKYSPTVPVLRLFLTAAFLFSIYAFIEDKRALIITFFLAVPAFASNWASFFFNTSTTHFIKDIFGALFFGYITVTILLGIFKKKTITSDLIYGSICVYLLIGLAWAYIYSALENIFPGSFNFASNHLQANPSLNGGQIPLSLFLYYSYVTLTTLGYGDITPMTPPAQSISILEAITGQFYLAILVARLVGIFISKKSN